MKKQILSFLTALAAMFMVFSARAQTTVGNGFNTGRYYPVYLQMPQSTITNTQYLNLANGWSVTNTTFQTNILYTNNPAGFITNVSSNVVVSTAYLKFPYPAQKDLAFQLNFAVNSNNVSNIVVYGARSLDDVTYETASNYVYSIPENVTNSSGLLSALFNVTNQAGVGYFKIMGILNTSTNANVTNGGFANVPTNCYGIKQNAP